MTSVPESAAYLRIQRRSGPGFRGLKPRKCSGTGGKRRRKAPAGGEGAKGFVDGDLIESFLDLKPEKAAEVAASSVGSSGRGVQFGSLSF